VSSIALAVDDRDGLVLALTAEEMQ